MDKIKYADLHVHLGAAIPPHMLWEIAHDQGLKLPTKDYWEFNDSMTLHDNITHSDYLTNRFKLAQTIQSSPLAMEKSVYYAISSAFRKSNVTTIELRFNPFLRNKEGVYDLDRIILSATIGMKKACIVYPVKAGLILEMDRSVTQAEAEILVDKAMKYKNDGIVGIDVSGYSPEGFSIDKFVSPYKCAKKAGLGLTFHTGEVTGQREMEEVISELCPHRIGHGLACVNDPGFLNFVKDEGIILEICPSSNLKLRIVDSTASMVNIIKTLINEDVHFLLNTDGPVYFNTNISDEYENFLRPAGCNLPQYNKIINVAHEYSFANILNKDY